MKIRSITAPNPGVFTLDGTRTYLLGETAVIDPGPAIESHVRTLVEAIPTVDLILITHRHADHAPAALPLREATGARIFAPEDVLGDAHVERRLHDGDFVDVAGTPVEVIATPGHTREHVCFLTADGDLFTGDTILGFGTTTIFPPDGNMGDYIESLRRLRSRNPKRIWPAHGPIRSDAIALIDEYIEHRLERERQVLAALADGAKTTAEIRRRVYGDLDEKLYDAAEIQVEAHLIKLREEGRLP